MTPDPNEGLTDSILRMRTCLSRVELAATRLAREAATPAARGLAVGISKAVYEIDDEIGDALRALRSESQEADIGDCRPILAAFRRRMSPILRAHDVAWCDDAVAVDLCIADRAAFEFSALVMLRTGIELVGADRTIDLSLVHGADTCDIGLRLGLDRFDPDEADTDPIRRIHALAARYRCSLTLENGDGAASVTLWLPSVETA